MQKLLTIGLLLAFLVCYLEWGNNHSFLFQVEYSILTSGFNAGSFVHPMILLPFTGQVLLLISLFQNQPKRKLILWGILLQGVLVLVILLAGCLALNPRIILSTMPYILLSSFVLYHIKKNRIRQNIKQMG